MIPVKLTMRNFMCYRDNVPPLDFTGIHLACLSGNNGNGKSAIIDAMTWALWGQTRARSDDDLVYAGQSEMEVQFDFAIGEQLYRIIRKHSRPRRQGRSGQSILEFQIATGDGFRAISGDGITQTQKKIVDTLHMDYDTFINSAYLRQGHADEFTRQAPSRRKEVLGTILGLARYDEFEERARETARLRQGEKARLESGIRDFAEELGQQPAYEAELARAQAEFSGLDITVKDKEAVLSALRQKREALEGKKAQVEQMEAHRQDAAKQLKLWEEQANQHRASLREYDELVSRRGEIEGGFARFIEARKLAEELERKLRRSAALNERRHALEMTVTRAQQEVLREHALTQKGVKENEARLLELPGLKSQLQQAQLAWQQLGEQENALLVKKQNGDELQAQVNRLESGESALRREIREIREKLELLSTRTEAKCPLCETELGADGLKLISKNYSREEQEKYEKLKVAQVELARRKKEYELLKSEIARAESRLGQEKAEVQGRTSVLKKDIAGIEDAERRLAEERQRLAEIEQRLAAKSFAVTEQGALAQVEIELASLGYNQQSHEQARRQLTELEHFEHSMRKLEEAGRLAGQEREAEVRAEEAAARLRVTLEADTRKSNELAAEIAVLPQVLTGLSQAEGELAALKVRHDQARGVVWGIKAKLEHCAETEKKKQEKESQLAAAAREDDIFTDLARAFGKGGIQALLIDAALPDIEAAANDLLGRMTDNRMHLKFETQRETRKGSVVETLDINIADELGTRNYEMFSGGEAFRINFAIRIALSKLLARRAGAPLPTLIIDEGFGTQDVTGIEKLKEAINSIQDDFEKIIVVTHIEELRDAFPIRIDVIKTAEGSTLSVN